MAQHGLGAPESRPDEDTCVIPATFDIDRDRRSWEQTAPIAWAADAPRRLAPAMVERLLRDRLRLQRNDVVVSSHYPEEFLLKFERKELCTAALDKGRLKMDDGTLVFIRPWRPLAHALSAAMPFRARIRLDGVPAYVWTASIVERVIGRTCALEEMDARSITMTDTRHISLWAWSSNPSKIPKVVWQTFTSRAPDGVTVAERQPARCLRGATFRVFVHLERVEDFTSASLDMATHDGRLVPYSPATSVFPRWHHGTVDGHAPVSGEDGIIPGEFDSRGTTRGGAPRVHGNVDNHPRDYRPRRRDDEGDDRDGQHGDHASRRAGRGQHDAAPVRPRSRSPRRREGGTRGNGGRRHDAQQQPPPSEAVGCFRQMGVVVLAEAKIRRVFGSCEVEERAALRSAMLRKAAELRRLIAMPDAPSPPVAAVPAMLLGLLPSAPASPPVADAAAVPTEPVVLGNEAWDVVGVVGRGFQALAICGGATGCAATTPPSPMSPARPATPSETPRRTPVATPLPASALLGPCSVAVEAPVTRLTSPSPDASPRLVCGIVGTPGSGQLGRFMASIVDDPPVALLPFPVAKPVKTKGINLSSPRRSGRIAQKKSKQRQ